MENNEWPIEEATLEAQSFLDTLADYTADENHQRILKLRAHWLKVFGVDEQGKADLLAFGNTFNRLIEGKFDKYF